jgi:hypothetical protein
MKERLTIPGARGVGIAFSHLGSRFGQEHRIWSGGMHSSGSLSLDRWHEMVEMLHSRLFYQTVPRFPLLLYQRSGRKHALLYMNPCLCYAHSSLIQLPSSICPSRFGPSFAHVSINPDLGSSSGKPLLLRTLSTSSLIRLVHSIRNFTASGLFRNFSLPTVSPNINAAGSLGETSG